MKSLNVVDNQCTQTINSWLCCTQVWSVRVTTVKQVFTATPCEYLVKSETVLSMEWHMDLPYAKRNRAEILGSSVHMSRRVFVVFWQHRVWLYNQPFHPTVDKRAPGEGDLSWPLGTVTASFPSDGERPEALTTPGSERFGNWDIYVCLEDIFTLIYR